MKHQVLTLLQVLKRSAVAILLAGGVAGATNFDLSLTKSADATSISAGGTVNFTIKVNNAGPYRATNVVIDDMLPKGFKFVSANLTPSKVDATSDPKIVQYFFNLGTIAAGSSKSITIKATGVAAANIVGPSIDDHYNYKNIAEVYSVDNAAYDPDSRPNNCDYTTITAGQPLQDDCAYVRVPVSGTTTPPSGTRTDLAVYKYVDLSNSRDPKISKFWVGDTVTYSLQVVNNGPAKVTNAVLKDYAETGLDAIAWTCSTVSGGAQCPAASGTGFPNFTIPSLPAGSELKVTYTAKVSVVDPQLTNYAEIQPPAGVTDTNPANNKDNAYICTFNPDLPTKYPQLEITKSSNGPWTVGQSGANYTLTVKNNSNVRSSGTVTIKDLLPTGITLNGTTPFVPVVTSTDPNTNTAWSCTVSSQVLTCTTPGPIIEGSSVSLTIPVNVSSSAVGSVTNRASVGGGGDPDPIPDPSTCTSTTGQCGTTTTTVTTPATAQCSSMYALVAPTGINGIRIQELSAGNVLGTVIADLPTGKTSATLAVSPDGTRFFTASDTDNVLRIYSPQTGTWTTGGTFAATARLVRMAVTPGGIGYAMDSNGNFFRFATTSPYGVTSLGKLNVNSTSQAGMYGSGDFFATADGKLYLLSSETGGTVNLWFVDPVTLKAEHLGNLTNTTGGVQYNGIAALPSGVYAANSAGQLAKVDVINVAMQLVGGTATGSTDLASCTYPNYKPNVAGVKSVKKVAGAAGTAVQPGDTLEYTIVVRNSGNLPAGGATFRDALPAGTTYVADSARINGFTTTVTNSTPTNLGGATYPLSSPVGICSKGAAACTNQVLKVDTTPGATDLATADNEAVITFRVTVNNPFTLDPKQVTNQAIITYNDGNTPPTDIPTNPVVTPVVDPAKLLPVKTVQNITAGGPVTDSASGKPGDVLEYCIKTTNVGGINATNIRFGDTVPANTNFLVGAYGAGRDIHVTTSTGIDTYYTAAQDADAGVLLNDRVSVNGGSFVLGSQQSFTVCFRATIH